MVQRAPRGSHGSLSGPSTLRRNKRNSHQVYAELEKPEVTWALGRVGLIGAGSAGSTSVRDGQNWFNVLDLQTSHVDLDMYRAVTTNGSREGFRRVHQWRAKLSTDEGRMVLGEWDRLYEDKNAPKLRD